jgi:hypothetical protein
MPKTTQTQGWGANAQWEKLLTKILEI